MLGNDDLSSVDELFTQVCSEFTHVHDMAGNKVVINGYEFIGMNHILDHPFGCKDRVVTEIHYIPQRQLSPVAVLSTPQGYDEIYHWLEYSRRELPYMRDVLNELPEPSNQRKAVYIMHMPPAAIIAWTYGFS